MPSAGRLDRRVEILRATISQNETGEQIETWAVWRTVWMGKKDIRAEERFRTSQELAAETTVWTTWFMGDLTTKDRLRAEGKTYDIVGIAELGRRSGMEITATAVQV